MALTKIGKEGITGISNSSDATAITIDASENVGIGTTSPSAPLNISATYSSTTTEQFRIQDNTGGKLDFFGHANGNKAIQAYADDGSTFYDIILNPLGGNVGIGTTAPAAPLHVVSSGNQDGKIRLGGDGTYYSELFWDYSASTFEINTVGAGLISFSTGNNVERMRIDSAGRVTMPAQPLFWARRTSSGSSGIQTGFASIINIGSHFNGSKFTAPIAGIYEFYHQSIGPTGTAVADVYIYKNGGKESAILSARPDETGATHASLSSAMGIASLAANDYIEIFTTAAIYSDANSWHKFGGRLIA